MRRFVVLGQTATASGDFSLDDLPGSSGRLDVLLRCVRAALLVSHGVRRDTIVYLVLGGGPRAPRTIKIDGRTSEYLRPDERSLAGAVRNLLGRTPAIETFAESTRGVSISRGGLDAVLEDLGAFVPYMLDERGADVRDAPIDLEAPVFFVGDHLGFDDDARARIAALSATSLSLGPTSLHADDAIAILSNELDRRAPTASSEASRLSSRPSSLPSRE
jgi:tRNA (pseudouridine54-N1)-methyltransferase